MATPVRPEGGEACTSVDELIILENSLSHRLSDLSDLNELWTLSWKLLFSINSVQPQYQRNL